MAYLVRLVLNPSPWRYWFMSVVRCQTLCIGWFDCHRHHRLTFQIRWIILELSHVTILQTWSTGMGYHSCTGLATKVYALIDVHVSLPKYIQLWMMGVAITRQYVKAGIAWYIFMHSYFEKVNTDRTIPFTKDIIGDPPERFAHS